MVFESTSLDVLRIFLFNSL